MNRYLRRENRMKKSHILPFVWMRGEEPQVIRTEIEKIHEAGIGAVCLEARPHPDYAGEGWWHDVDIVIEEAKKRDMQIWILDDAHFPTGMANNGMERHPEQARRFLYTQFVDVTGPVPYAQVDVDLLLTKQITWMDLGKPVSKPLYDETRLLSVTACRIQKGDTLTGETIDLTSRVQDGYVTVDIPEGVWRIFVTFSTTAIGPKPEYINYIEADSVRVLINEVYEKHYEKYAELFGNTIAGFFSDEPGFYNTDSYGENNHVGLNMTLPWGRELETLLVEKYGQKLYQDLPLLFAEEMHGQERFLRTLYMDLVSALYEKNFSRQLGDWCRAHKVEYIGHIVEDSCAHMRLGAGVGHYFRAMAGQDMAGVDNIGYQLMPGNEIANRHTGFQDMGPNLYHYQISKLGASAAAIDPLKKGRLMCETFGAYGWRLGVRDMKWLVDYSICQGVNYFVPHAFSMAKYPDADCPPHFYARGMNPQFPYFCDLMGYTNRLARLFSDGRGVFQAAVLYEAEADWAGQTMRGYVIGKELRNHQIDFLFVPADILSESDGELCSVKDGKLEINKHTLSVLIIPECEYLPSKAASFIARHPELPVLYVNQLPKGIAGTLPEEPQELLAALKDRECVPLERLGATLLEKNIRDDLYLSAPDANLHQYHYRKDGKDYWFLMNASLSATVDTTLCLPKAGAFGCYDARKDVSTELEVKGGTAHLVLPPYGSVVLMADPEGSAKNAEIGELAGTLVPEDYELELKEIGKQETERIAHFSLSPVSTFKRDFSGEMIYRTTIQIDTLPKQAILHAQYVYECMTVCVNGTALPSVLTPPYELDLAAALHEGANELEIHVVTTALRDANTKPGIFGKERTILEPTGMFGNVEIRLYK